MNAYQLYSAYQYVNSNRLDDPGVLVKIAEDLKAKQPEIDSQTYAYRLMLKFSNYQPNN